MPPQVFMLLGRTFWRRNGTAWCHETAAPTGDVLPAAVELLRSSVRTGRGARAVLIYEPEGLTHDGAETPNAKRRDFAEIERIRAEFPAVGSEQLAWGVEPPAPAPGGTYSTVVHAEMMPGLISLRQTLWDAGVRLAAAWSAYTVAMALLPAGRDSGRGHSVLFLLPDYVGLARAGGAAPLFKAWPGALRESDWADVSSLLGEAGLSPSPNPPAGARRPRGTIVVTAAGLERRCPYWDALLSGGKVSALLGVDALAEAALGLPASNPANLAESFPRPVRLDAALAVAAAAGLAGTAILGALGWHERTEFEQASGRARARESSMESQLARLTANERRIALLRAERKNREDLLPSHCREALEGFAAALPDAVTLSSLNIACDGVFQFEAIVVGGGFNPAQLHADLERAGFEPASGTGWAYDPAARRLKGQGRFVPAKT